MIHCDCAIYGHFGHDLVNVYAVVVNANDAVVVYLIWI